MLKVSVLVPVYGVEKYIERCVRSLFEQTMMKDIEYVFVDDCTQDSSVEILKSILDEYPDRKEQVKIIRHEINKGQACARNTGLAHANGEYVCFVDSDDFIELNMLATLYETAIRTNADIVRSNLCYIHNGKTIYKQKLSSSLSKDEDILDILKGKYMAYLWNGIYKKSIMVDNHIFFPEGVNFCEDYATLPRILYYASNVTYLKESLYHYIQRKSSTTHIINKKHIDDIKIVYNTIEFFFADKNKLYRDIIEYTKVIAVIFLIAYLQNTKIQKQTLYSFNDINFSKYYPNMSNFCKTLYVMEKHNLWAMLRIFINFVNTVSRMKDLFLNRNTN